MLVPNVQISFQAADGRSYGPKLEPSYMARLYKILWRGKLDEKGVVVEPLEKRTHPSLRFTEIGNLDLERARVDALCESINGIPVRELAFPDDLFEQEIARQVALAADLEEVLDAGAAPLDPAITDVIGYKDEDIVIARALQDAEVCTLEKIGTMSLMSLSSIPGVTPGLAKRLLAAAAKAAEPAIADKIAAAAKALAAADAKPAASKAK